VQHVFKVDVAGVTVCDGGREKSCRQETRELSPCGCFSIVRVVLAVAVGDASL